MKKRGNFLVDHLFEIIAGVVALAVVIGIIIISRRDWTGGLGFIQKLIDFFGG